MSSSSTSTSESSDDSSMSEEVSQAQDEHKILKIRIPLKRKREDEESEDQQSVSESSPQSESSDSEKKPPKKIRRLIVPPTQGWFINLLGMEEAPIRQIVENFNAPPFQKDFPGSSAVLYEASSIKRLPTKEERAEFDAETKRLAKEKQAASGNKKKELTEEEKEKRKAKNALPEVQERKREIAKLRREAFNDCADAKKKYKELVKSRLKPLPPRTRPKKVKVEEKPVDTDMKQEE
jgi:hypothetical protein